MKLSLTRLLLILVLTVASLTVYSQPVNQVFEEWVTADGTQNYFIKAAVETDADGYTYVAGATLNGDGNYDLMVTKYGDVGEVIWTDQYDGAETFKQSRFPVTPSGSVSTAALIK